MHSSSLLKPVKSNQRSVHSFDIANQAVERVENKDFKWFIGLCLANRKSFNAARRKPYRLSMQFQVT